MTLYSSTLSFCYSDILLRYAITLKVYDAHIKLSTPQISNQNMQTVLSIIKYQGVVDITELYMQALRTSVQKCKEFKRAAKVCDASKTLIFFVSYVDSADQTFLSETVLIYVNYQSKKMY